MQYCVECGEVATVWAPSFGGAFYYLCPVHAEELREFDRRQRELNGSAPEPLYKLDAEGERTDEPAGGEG